MVKGIGKLDADLTSRINENLALVASASINTNLDFEAFAGIKIDW